MAKEQYEEQYLLKKLWDLKWGLRAVLAEGADGIPVMTDTNRVIRVNAIETAPVPRDTPAGLVYVINSHDTSHYIATPPDGMEIPTITYSFNGLSNITSWGDSCVPFDAKQEHLTRNVLFDISSRWNVNFHEVAAGNAPTPHVVFGACDYTSSSTAGKANFPGGSSDKPVAITLCKPQSMVLSIFNPFSSLPCNGNMLSPITPFDPMARTLRHEIGHGIFGFVHTHISNNGEPVFPACSGVMAYSNTEDLLKGQLSDKYGPIEEFLGDKVFGQRPGHQGTLPYQNTNGTVQLDNTGCQFNIGAFFLMNASFLPFQVVGGVLFGIARPTVLRKLDGLYPQKDKEVTYGQYACGIASDTLSLGVRYIFPVSAEMSDITSRFTRTALRSYDQGDGGLKIFGKGLLAGIEQFGVHSVFRAASLALGRYTQPVMHAIYAANDIGTQLSESPKEPENETRTQKAKRMGWTILDGVVSRMNVLRYLPGLFTKCCRGKRKSAESEVKMDEYLDKMEKGAANSNTTPAIVEAETRPITIPVSRATIVKSPSFVEQIRVEKNVSASMTF